MGSGFEIEDFEPAVTPQTELSSKSGEDPAIEGIKYDNTSVRGGLNLLRVSPLRTTVGDSIPRLETKTQRRWNGS